MIYSDSEDAIAWEFNESSITWRDVTDVLLQQMTKFHFCSFVRLRRKTQHAEVYKSRSRCFIWMFTRREHVVSWYRERQKQTSSV